MPENLSVPGQTQSLDKKWLQGKSRLELIDMLIDIAIELRSRTERDTSEVAPLVGEPPVFEKRPPGISVEYLRLPFDSPKSQEQATVTTWKILLVSSNQEHPPFGLEIYDDVTIGRTSGDQTPDLDLSPYNAEGLGISREHALLRPTTDSLLLFDLGSANGTFRNGVKARLGAPQTIMNGDVISFGGLHFKVSIQSSPGG